MLVPAEMPTVAVPTSGFVPAAAAPAGAMPATAVPAATGPITGVMGTATVPVSTAVPATAAVSSLDRASDSNCQRGGGCDEQFGCTSHRRLSGQVIRTANDGPSTRIPQ